jgi:hypothetical protein
MVLVVWLALTDLAGANDPEVRLLAKLKEPGPCAWSTCGARTKALQEGGFRVTSRFRNMRYLMQVERTAQLPQRLTQDPAVLCRNLMASGLFEYVEPDFVIERHSVPNDAAFLDGRLWGLRNNGQNGGASGVDIGASEAWQVTTGSRDVIVAIVDAGIRYTHLEVRDNLWTNSREIPGNARDDDGNGYVDDFHGINAIVGSGNPMDDDGHGTHVAATIGASANGGGPQVGVAWHVRLMALKFLDRDGYGYTSDAVECLDYAISQGVDIINASWGSYSYSRALFDAVQRCRDAGVLVVAAAGNEGLDSDRSASYPANFAIDNVVAVAAVDRRGKLADYSNFGASTVHLAAPGVSVFSASALHDRSYESMDGTSMAAPHVAGAAALLRAVDRDVSPARMRQVLIEAATPLASLSGRTVSGGLLNAYGALAIQAGWDYQPPSVADWLPEMLRAAQSWRQSAVQLRDYYYGISAPQLAEAYYCYYEGLARFNELSYYGHHTHAAGQYYLYLSYYYLYFYSHYGFYATAWYYFSYFQAFGNYYWYLALYDPWNAASTYHAYMKQAQSYYLHFRRFGFW